MRLNQFLAKAGLGSRRSVEALILSGRVKVCSKPGLLGTTLDPAAGLYYSDDGGQTWASTGLNDTLLAVAISELDPDHVIAVNDQGEVFASRDSGISWSNE